VIGSPLDYLEAAEYAPAELRGRLLEVADPPMAVKYVRTDTPDTTNRILAQFVPIHVESLTDFQASHQRFFLRSAGPFDWLRPYLIENHYLLKLLSKTGDDMLFLVER